MQSKCTNKNNVANHNNACPCTVSSPTETAPVENDLGDKQFEGIVLTMFKRLREDMMVPRENKKKELNEMKKAIQV